MKIDKDIYVDVEGTLERFCLVADGKPEGIRDNAVEFIQFLVDNFKNVYWLTSCPESYIYSYLEINNTDLVKKIKHIDYYGSKYQALDYSRPFYFFDDEIEYDCWHKLGLLKDSIPAWKKEPIKSKINSKIHTLYYIPTDAPIDFLSEVMEDIKKRENID